MDEGRVIKRETRVGDKSVVEDFEFPEHERTCSVCGGAKAMTLRGTICSLCLAQGAGLRPSGDPPFAITDEAKAALDKEACAEPGKVEAGGKSEDALCWVPTWSGAKFWPLSPEPDMFRIADIAHHLSLINRFNGGTRAPYSVAQHSVLVSRVVPGEDALAGLMHDAAEAYLSDVARPMKQLLPEYRAIEDRIMEVCAEAFGFSWPKPSRVEQADRDLLATEWRDLVRVPRPRWPFEANALEGRIAPWSAARAEREFLERFDELEGLGRRERGGRGVGITPLA